MKHIHWLIPGKNYDLNSLQNNTLASVRLRTYVSSFNSKSFTFSFGENMPFKTDILVVGKIGSYNLAERSQNWTNQVKMCHFADGKVILDYTDNHLMIRSPMTEFYRSILQYIDVVITPSNKMSSIVSNIWKGPIETINDSIEVEINEWKEDKKAEKLLWFGHSTNIIYLIRFLYKYQDIINPYSLSIITNQVGIDYFNKFNRTNIRFKTFLWSINKLLKESQLSDLCIIPSDKNNPLKQGAGHNRLITALALGMPVVATSIASYEQFNDYFIDDESAKIKDVLINPNIIRNKVMLAQKKVVPLFNKFNLSRKWQRVFSK